MKKGRVLSLKRTGLFRIANKDKTKIFLFFLLVSGIVFGVILFSKEHNIGVFTEKFADFYIKSHSYSKFLKVFISSLLFFTLIDLVFLISVKPVSEIFALQKCKRIGVRELRLTA